MDAYETTPDVLNIAETCAASVSIDDLVQMCTDPTAPGPLNTSVKLAYGSILGSRTLRERVAAHCSTEGEKLTAEDVIITQGAIGANFLSLYTLIGPGDHVVCVYPTYQQLYDVPRSVGAEVSLWKLKPEEGFVPNLDDLKTLLKDNTKVCQEPQISPKTTPVWFISLENTGTNPDITDDHHQQPQQSKRSSNLQ